MRFRFTGDLDGKVKHITVEAKDRMDAEAKIRKSKPEFIVEQCVDVTPPPPAPEPPAPPTEDQVFRKDLLERLDKLEDHVDVIEYYARGIRNNLTIIGLAVVGWSIILIFSFLLTVSAATSVGN